MNKPKKHHYKLAQKIEHRTKIRNCILFLKKIHKVDGKNNIILNEKYWPGPTGLRFNCLNCKYDVDNERPELCPKYDYISIRTAPNGPHSLWWVCYGHKFKNEK